MGDQLKTAKDIREKILLMLMFGTADPNDKTLANPKWVKEIGKEYGHGPDTN